MTEENEKILNGIEYILMRLDMLDTRLNVQDAHLKSIMKMVFRMEHGIKDEE